MGNLTPLPILSEIKVGKMACFGFCAASFFIWGEGGLLVHFILSKIVGLLRLREFKLFVL